MISGYDEGLHKVVLKGALQKNLIGYNIMPVYKSLLKKEAPSYDEGRNSTFSTIIGEKFRAF